MKFYVLIISMVLGCEVSDAPVETRPKDVAQPTERDMEVDLDQRVASKGLVMTGRWFFSLGRVVSSVKGTDVFTMTADGSLSYTDDSFPGQVVAIVGKCAVRGCPPHVGPKKYSTCPIVDLPSPPEVDSICYIDETWSSSDESSLRFGLRCEDGISRSADFDVQLSEDYVELPENKHVLVLTLNSVSGENDWVSVPGGSPGCPFIVEKISDERSD